MRKKGPVHNMLGYRNSTSYITRIPRQRAIPVSIQKRNSILSHSKTLSIERYIALHCVPTASSMPHPERSMDSSLHKQAQARMLHLILRKQLKHAMRLTRLI